MRFRPLSFLSRGGVYLLPFLVLLGATTARLVFPRFLDRLSTVAFDIYEQVDPRPLGNVPIRIVDIDDASLKAVGQWPWPRTIIAELVTRLHEAGAAIVAFDILFSEPDRTSPELLLPLLSQGSGDKAAVEKLVATLPHPDQVLATAMRTMPVVTAFGLTYAGSSNPFASKNGVVVNGAAGQNPLRLVQSYPNAISDLPTIEAAASGNGFFNQSGDWDHVVRSVPLVLRLGDKPVFSLAAEVLRLATGASTYIVRGAGANAEQSFGENTGLTDIKIGPLDIPTDSQGRVWVHFAREPADRFVSAAAILSGHFDKRLIAGNIVLIGTSATALNDIQATPVDSAMPGVEIHSQVIEQALQGQFLTRPDWAIGAEIIFSVLVGGLLIVLLPRIGALPSAVLGAAAVAGVLAASWFAFDDRHWLIDPVYPIAILSIVYVMATLLSYFRTERRQRDIRNAFSRYMSPHYVAELAKHPEKLALGGETKIMTIMFCDIRGFTTLSEGLDARSLTQLMNSFLTPMTEIIAAHQGTIDKYIGDCIMAFWNAPLDDPSHATNAVRAAQAMRHRLVELNKGWAEEAEKAGKTHQQLRIGIGINTGECVVGNFGSMQRFDYSILGDPVNLASRVEGLGKLYGIDLVIAEEAAQRLDKPPSAAAAEGRTRGRARVAAPPEPPLAPSLVEVDLVAVKGKKQAVRIFTIPRDETVEAAFIDRHGAMLAAYRHQDWPTALGTMAEPCLGTSHHLAPVYDLYRTRIAHFQLEAPPDDWDGVYTALEK